MSTEQTRCINSWKEFVKVFKSAEYLEERLGILYSLRALPRKELTYEKAKERVQFLLAQARSAHEQSFNPDSRKSSAEENLWKTALLLALQEFTKPIDHICGVGNKDLIEILRFLSHVGEQNCFAFKQEPYKREVRAFLERTREHVRIRVDDMPPDEWFDAVITTDNTELFDEKYWSSSRILKIIERLQLYLKKHCKDSSLAAIADGDEKEKLFSLLRQMAISGRLDEAVKL